MSQLRALMAIVAMAACAAAGAVAQPAGLDAPDRFSFGGPNDGSYRLYDRATGELIAQTDALLARIYVLPENGRANAYVVLSEGSEDTQGFVVWKTEGARTVQALQVSGVGPDFAVDDLNDDGLLDFTFYLVPGPDFAAEYGLLAARDYISGPGGHRPEVPACSSARNALARQRVSYAIDLNSRKSRPDVQASAFLLSELDRLAKACPSP
jgi:hypothetical protein